MDVVRSRGKSLRQRCAPKPEHREHVDIDEHERTLPDGCTMTTLGKSYIRRQLRKVLWATGSSSTLGLVELVESNISMPLFQLACASMGFALN